MAPSSSPSEAGATSSCSFEALAFLALRVLGKAFAGRHQSLFWASLQIGELTTTRGTTGSHLLS
jgi:hypothetical protein